jgi:hypothetical protein
MTVETTIPSVTAQKPSLTLEHATIEDVPKLTRLWYNAFSIPAMLAIWPDTPGVRQWWDEVIRDEMLNKPQEKYLKVVDISTGRIAAYAKWSLQTAEDRGPRFPAWHPDMDPCGNDEFVRNLESSRARLVGGKKNFCMSYCISAIFTNMR